MATRRHEKQKHAMTGGTNHWEVIKQLFDAALKQEPARRSSFLSERCQHPALRAEVERLLAEHDQAGSFLSNPPVRISHNPAVPQNNVLPPGTVIAERFKIATFLGSGGMGVVYRALDLQHQQIVALKMLNRTGALDNRVRMTLVSEARTATRLQHPNIVKVHEIGQHKAILYLVMEYVDGFSLDRYIKVGPIRSKANVEFKLLVMIQVCSALAFAHGMNVIHRDIKPGNIIVPHQGKGMMSKIVDFGLAKMIEGAGLMDSSTQNAGTVLYMSPEQLKGRAPDNRSDIWSAGVTFYELLAYRRPFSGTNLGSVTTSILNDPIDPLDASLPHSDKLMKVLERALAKNPDERYQSVVQFLQDLMLLLHAIRPDMVTVRPHDATSEQVSAPNQPQHTVTVASSDGNTRYLPPIGQQSQGRVDSQPDLGFSYRSSGRVDFQKRAFSKSGVLERIKQGRWAPSALQKLTALLYGVTWFTFIISLFGLTMLQWFRSLSFDQRAALLVAKIYIPLLSALGIAVLLAKQQSHTTPRRCRTCRWSHMARVSEWTRYVNSNAEIGWGHRDCIEAMKRGWYDAAANLLIVHGAQEALIYSVIRFSLEFWECHKCGDQSALLIVQQKIDSEWLRQDGYHESYKYAEGRAIVRVRCPECRWEPSGGSVWVCKCGHQWNTFTTRGVCPQCSFRWEQTSCLTCGRSSPHSSWYGATNAKSSIRQ